MPRAPGPALDRGDRRHGAPGDLVALSSGHGQVLTFFTGRELECPLNVRAHSDLARQSMEDGGPLVEVDRSDPGAHRCPLLPQLALS